MNRTSTLLVGCVLVGVVAWSGGAALARPADLQQVYQLHGPKGREVELAGQLLLTRPGVDPALGESARVEAAPVEASLVLRRDGALVYSFKGELARRQSGQGWTLHGTVPGQAGAEPASLDVSLDLARDGTLTGSVRQAGAGQGTSVWGSRWSRGLLSSDPRGPTWSSLPAEAKGDILWQRVLDTAFSQRGMPAMESRGALSTNLLDTKAAAVLSLLRRSFDTKGDVREPRHKIFHTFGAVARVELVPVGADVGAGPEGVGLAGRLGGASSLPAAGDRPAGAPAYTGVFQTGASGLVRLSLGAGELFYMPGLALKLFTFGGDSLDVLAIPTFAPSQDKEFFAPTNALTNSIQPPSGPLEPLLELGMRYFKNVAADPLHRPIEHLAARTDEGLAVAKPVAPYAVVFRPSPTVRALLAAAKASNLARGAPNGDDLRTLLGALRPDTVIYEVWASDTKPVIGSGPGPGERLVARLVTRSAFVASSFGDRELNFVHTGATVAPGNLEKLDRPVAAVLAELDGSIRDALHAANRRIKDRLGLGR